MMSPAGRRHGRVAMRLGKLLAIHVDDHQLGEVHAAETGFLLERDPDTVRAPDVSFIHRDRLPADDDDAGFAELSPDLVAEVVSPRDSFAAVEEKALFWLSCGVKLLLVVNPAARRIHAYRSADRIHVLEEGETLDATDVVPGWKLPVRDVFT